eukprot:g4029.t1
MRNSKSSSTSHPSPDMQLSQFRTQSHQVKESNQTHRFGAVGFSDKEQHRIGEILSRQLGSDIVAQRRGAGGSRVHYLEGHRAIDLANQTFGFCGWGSSIIELQTDFCDQLKKGKWSAGVTAIVRVELKDGCFHEDVGYGVANNLSSKGDALQKAKKSAVTDATKRALRLFGQFLGNCVYDKNHTKSLRSGQNKVTVMPGEGCERTLNGKGSTNCNRSNVFNGAPQNKHDSYPKKPLSIDKACFISVKVPKYESLRQQQQQQKQQEQNSVSKERPSFENNTKTSSSNNPLPDKSTKENYIIENYNFDEFDDDDDALFANMQCTPTEVNSTERVEKKQRLS